MPFQAKGRPWGDACGSCGHSYEDAGEVASGFCSARASTMSTVCVTEFGGWCGRAV
jgi:hypothetical protein